MEIIYRLPPYITDDADRHSDATEILVDGRYWGTMWINRSKHPEEDGIATDLCTVSANIVTADLSVWVCPEYIARTVRTLASMHKAVF